MSGAPNPSQRAVRQGDIEFVVPTDAPVWCADLAMGEDEARRVVEPYRRCTIGPVRLTKRGKYVAAVEVRKPGAPFITYDARGKVRGIYGSWSSAAKDLVGLAIEFEERRQ